MVEQTIRLTKKGIEAQCVYCNQWATDIEVRRLNTAYVDDTLNWFDGCLDCYTHQYEMYEEQWADYYSGRL